jgi:hypothetical protein
MSLSIVLLIMLLTGLFGGLINWALQAAPGTSDAPVQTSGRCLLIGLGATILIPLFLEIAQSKLLDNMCWCCSLTEDCVSDSTALKPVAASKPDTIAKAISKADSIKALLLAEAKRKADSVLLAAEKTKPKPAQEPKPGQEPKPEQGTKPKRECPPLKDYLIFGAYCLLAAVAGPRFINGLLDGVLKDKQIAALAKDKKAIAAEKDKAVEEKEKVVEEKDQVVEEKAKVEKEKEEIEKIKTKLAAQNQLAAKHDEENVLMSEGVLEVASPDSPTNSLLSFRPGAIIHKDDLQKGRFGGKSEHNGRALRAEVGNESSSGFFRVKIWVESTDPERPLEDVMFFLHDSFRPSVYVIKKEDFKDGKAMDQFEAYGAFTVGAVTDNGDTLLELDLSELVTAPKAFRER